MFRSKTVFVLGAGASEEVGLPIGKDLKNIIAEKIDIKFQPYGGQISGDYQIMHALWQHVKQPDGNKGNPNPWIHAAWQIRDALPHAISIDNYLDAFKTNEKIALCGKLGIVKSILEAERNSRLFINPLERSELTEELRKTSNTWFAGFLQILTEDRALEEIDKIFENIAFINFNYDRCLEQYLLSALQVYYKISEARAVEVISRLKVLRPYGSVGALPVKERQATHQIPFGSEHADLLSLSSSIKTFNEQIEDETALKEIKTSVKSAENIIFLGFAFHRQNLDLLSVKGLSPHENREAKNIYGTAFKISGSDCEVIKAELKEALYLPKQPNHHKDIILRNDLKCVDLLNEYWRSLTA